MSAPVRDPVHRARYSFEPDGQNLIVDCWIEPGGKLPEHLHPRQEERWSVIDGRIRLGLGNTKRVIGPADGETVVPPGTKHSLESVSEVEAHLRCLAVPALVEVNLSGETSKSGVPPEGLRALLRAYGDVRGLMTMPPPAADPEDSRTFFRRLRELAAEHELHELSMGTSQDYRVAIEEGATLVRVGSVLYQQ